MTLLPLGPQTPPSTCEIPRTHGLFGQNVILEALSTSHAVDLWECAQGADESWTYLGYGPFSSFSEFSQHIERLADQLLQPFFAVIPINGKASGWMSFCDIEPQNSALEIGSIWFSNELQRTRASTEAIYLLLNYAFSEGFNRIAWRCNALNTPSRRTAERLGFVYEGTWRKAQIIKGRWRDTSWYSQLFEDWPENKAVILRWLSDDNFDEEGQQLTRLRE
ncbi:MAG: GNAT family protein [Parasphingorhabdus sp.]